MTDVTVVIGVDNKGAITGMKQVSGAATDIEKNSMKAGSALADVAKIAGGFVLAQGLMKLPGLLTGFIGGASDLNESLSKVRTVFGENAKEIESWASTAAKSLGMSKGAALEAAGTFGNFLQAMGATSPAATKMSKDMVQLATDLGSFNNADPTEVLLALRSGLSGEAEPLRKFGVAISDAAVKAKALQLGLKGVGGELTEQEKIQARYAIIMEQTSMAQGDFARTSDGLANQTKILKAMFKDAGDELGTALLPGIVAIMGTIIQLVPWVISLGSAIGGKLKDAFDFVADGAKRFVGNVQWLVENGGGLMDIVAGDRKPTFWEKLAYWVSLALPPLIEISKLAFNGLMDVGAIAWDKLKEGTDALKELAATKFDQVAPQLERIRDAVRDVRLKDFADAWDDIKRKVQPAIDTLTPLADRVLVALREEMASVKATLGPLGESFKDLGEALKPLAPYIGTALVVAIGALLIALESLVRVFGGTVTTAIKAITLLIEGIALAIEGVTKVVQEWGPKVGSAMGTVAKVFEANLEIIVGLFKPLMNIGEGVINGIVNGIKAGTGKVIDAAKSMVDAIEGAIPDWIPHSPSVAGVLIGQGLVFGIAKGIEDETDSLDGPLTGIAKKFEGFAGDLLGGFKELGREIVTDFKETVGSLYDNVPDYVKKLSPAAGGSKDAAGPFIPNPNQYQGGGQMGFLGGGVGPNGTVWDDRAQAYVKPWEVGLNNPNGTYGDMAPGQEGLTGAPPIVINVGTINARDSGEARMAAHDIAYTLATAGL